jgi:hypothetical protein
LYDPTLRTWALVNEASGVNHSLGWLLGVVGLLGLVLRGTTAGAVTYEYWFKVVLTGFWPFRLALSQVLFSLTSFGGLLVGVYYAQAHDGFLLGGVIPVYGEWSLYLSPDWSR